MQPETTLDPNRAAVERVDGVVRDSEVQLITDPTVFVKGAALGGLTLIALGRMGAMRALAVAIKSMASQLVRSQQALRTELAAIAGGKRLDVPGALIYPDEQMLQQGQGLSGSAFDDWFVQHLVDELFKATALYQSAQGMTDAQLAAFARRTLPQLEAARQAAVALPRG